MNAGPAAVPVPEDKIFFRKAVRKVLAEHEQKVVPGMDHGDQNTGVQFAEAREAQKMVVFAPGVFVQFIYPTNKGVFLVGEALPETETADQRLVYCCAFVLRVRYSSIADQLIFPDA